MVRTTMKKAVAIAAMSAMSGAFVPALSYAACTQADLTGTWYTMIVGGNVVSNEYASTARCKLVINSAGTVAANSLGCKARTSTNGTTATTVTVALTGGRLIVNSSCAISGTIGVRDASGASTYSIGFAQMARDKNTFAYTAYSGTDADLGHAVKQ